MDGEEDDYDNDFIRKPKCFHSTPRLSSFQKLGNNKGHLAVAPCDSISPVGKPPLEYFNPFSPDGKAIVASKVNAQKNFKRLSISDHPPKLSLDDSSSSENLPQSDGDNSLDIPKRPRLREMNISRFNEEFILLEEIGKGVHGCVYKCLNRMNGCIYAVKRTLLPINSGFQERSVRNEIYAHGVLFNHPNIICNFSSWIEEGYAFIQNEYCDFGSLEEYIKDNVLSESLLRNLLLQMAQALHYIHSKGLAHMDLKPGNILIKSECTEDDDSGVGEKIDDLTFKLGDFGHVISLDEERDVEEGDCRYLPREILEGNLKNLDKSDIFSLGLTVYEVAGGGPLPKNGEEWQDIRNGKLKNLDGISMELNDILVSMVHPQAEKRPSALNLVKMLKLSQSLPHAEDDLSFIHQFYHNNTRLEHKVETNGFIIRELFKSHRQLHDQLQSGIDSTGYYSRDMSSFSGKRSGSDTESRIVGKKAKRSNSTMF